MDDDDFDNAWSSAQARLSQIKRELPSYPGRPLRIARVTQADAQLLDNELEHILLEPVTKALQMLRDPSTFLPELSAVLRFSLLAIALHQSGASYGSRLQNLVYRDEWAASSLHPSSAAVLKPHTSRYLLYATLCVLPGYLHTKLRDAMLSRGWSDYPDPRSTFALFSPWNKGDARDVDRRKRERKRWAWESWNSLEKVWQLGKLVNFLVFLHDGRYRTLIDRMLGLRLVYRQRNFARQVSFEFLNRQLVWEAFTEFLLFLLPLINLRRIRLRLTRSLHSTPLSPYLPSFLTPSTSKTQGLLPNLSRTTCPLCYTRTTIASPNIGDADPTDPTVTMFGNFGTRTESDSQVRTAYEVDCCGGRYCYYCIVGQLVRWDEERAGLDGAWSCVRCGKEVGSVKRVEKGDVEEVEEKEKS